MSLSQVRKGCKRKKEKKNKKVLKDKKTNTCKRRSTSPPETSTGKAADPSPLQPTRTCSPPGTSRFQHGFLPGGLIAPPGVTKLEKGLLSTLMMKNSLVQHEPTGLVSLCLEGIKWAALTWPVRELARHSSACPRVFKVSEEGPAKFVHATDLAHWRVIPVAGSAQTLLGARLATPAGLTLEEMFLVMRMKGLTGSRPSTRKQFLEALAASEGDDDFVKQVIERDGPPSTKMAAQLANDVVCGATYEALNEDDRREFADVGEDLRKGRPRRRALHWRKHRKSNRP
jgi:hypothetical protein